MKLLQLALDREPFERLGFDLPYPLSRDPEPPSDLGETERLALETVAQPDDLAFPLWQSGDGRPQRFEVERNLDVFERLHIPCWDELVQRGTFIQPDRAIEARHGTRGLA